MRRIMLGLAATLALLVGTTALATDANAYQNTPSDRFHWCIGTLHGYSGQSIVYEECYEIYQYYVNGLNDHHMGSHLIYSLYRDRDYGGWSLALQAGMGCVDGPLYLPQMPAGWNDTVTSAKVWDGNCGILYLYLNNGYNTYIADCGLANPDIDCRLFPNSDKYLHPYGVNDVMSSAYVAFH